jgi:TolB protein
MNPARFLFLLFLLILSGPEVEAGALPSWLSFWKSGTKVPSTKVEKKSIWVSDFTGGTGVSARQALVAELNASREFQITQEKAEFTIRGSSVGGRITARVTSASGKEWMERTYAAPGLDENAKALADDIILTITGRPGLATSRIVFVSDKSGTKQVYLCDADGREVLQVTHHTHGAVSPSLNSDASAVAYTSYRNGFPVVQWLDLGQGWERTVTDTPGSSFGASFSPDGQKLALVMSFLGNPEIFVTDLTTSTAACISDTTGAPSSPSWHPDGKQVIFADDRGDGPRLYIAEVPETSESEAKLLRWRTGYSFCTDPEFSPDGQSVAFTTQVGGQYAVVVKGWPNGAAKVIQGGGASHPSWSPNGRSICYAQRGALYVQHLASGQRRAILEKHGQITEPRWMK